MVRNVIRGISISLFAAIIVEFVLYFFQLIMPNTLFEGNEIPIFIIITGINYVIYSFLPSTDESVINNPTDLVNQ